LAAAVLPHDGERPLRRQPEVELAQHGVAGPRIGEGDSLEADTGLGRRWRPGPGKPQLGTLCGCGQPQDVRYGSYAEPEGVLAVGIPAQAAEAHDRLDVDDEAAQLH